MTSEEHSSRYASDQAGRHFLTQLTRGFQTIEESLVREYVSPAEAATAAIELADEAFAAFPMPDRLLGDKTTQQAMTDAHHAHLDLLRKYAENSEATVEVARAYGKRTRAMQRMEAALESPEYTARFDTEKRSADMVRAARMTFGKASAAPPGATEPWTRGDIAVAAANGEYDTLAVLVADEYEAEVDSLRGEAEEEPEEEQARASTLVDLERTHRLGRFDVDPVASLERKRARDDARATVRLAIQRGLGRRGARPEFGNLVAAAERLRAHPLLLEKDPDRSDAVVNAATQYFVQSTGRVDSTALTVPSDTPFGEIEYAQLTRVVRSMSQTLSAVYQWVSTIGSAQDTIMKRITVHTNSLKAQLAALKDKTSRINRKTIQDVYVEAAVEQFQSEQGYFFFDAEEATYLKLPYLGVIAERRDVYNAWSIETSDEPILNRRIRKDYERLLIKVIDANDSYNTTASIKSTPMTLLKEKVRVAKLLMQPLSEEEAASEARPTFKGRRQMITPVQAFAPDTNKALTIDDPRVKEAIARANMTLVAIDQGNVTTLADVTGVPGGAPESVLLNDTRTMAVDAQFVNSTFADVNDFLVNGELLTSDPETDAPLRTPELQPTLISNSGYDTAHVWEAGFKGPLAPVDVELYMGSMRVANGSKLARLPQLLRYAQSVGVLFRASELGVLTRSVAEQQESITPFYDLLTDAVDADAQRLGLGRDAGVNAVLQDMVRYTLEHTRPEDTSSTPDALIAGDRMLPLVPPKDTELHNRALFIIDHYVALSQRENLQIAYTLGPILSMLQVDHDMQREVESLDTIVIDAARDATLNETGRDAIRRQVQDLQLDELHDIHNEMLRTIAVPAEQNFRRLRAGGDGAVLNNTILLMRRVDGRLLGEKFADTTIELIYSVPKADTVDDEEMAARRILVRNTTPRQRAIVRIDADLACDSVGLGNSTDTCRVLTITDTVARIDPDTVSRVQLLDTVTRNTLTMRIVHSSDNRLIREVFRDVPIGIDAGDPTRNDAVTLFNEAQHTANSRFGGSALAAMLTAFRSTDETGGEWWTTHLMRLIRATLVNPALDISDVLLATQLQKTPGNDVMRAHSIAFASLEYLVTLFAIARTTGSYAVTVLLRLGFVDRVWRACRDALTSVVKTLRLHIIWNMIAGAVRWALNMAHDDDDDDAKAEQARKQAEVLLGGVDAASADGRAPDESWWLLFDKFLDAVLPEGYTRHAKLLVRLMRSLTSVVTRMLSALVTVLVAAVSDSDYISIGVLGVLRLASLWVLWRTFPIWSRQTFVFFNVVVYRVVTIGIMQTVLHQSRTTVAALMRTVTSERRAKAASNALVLAGLLSMKIAPYLANRAYPVAALVPGGEELTANWDQVHSTFPAVLGAAQPVTPGADIELTVFAARSLSNMIFPLLALMVKRAVNLKGTLASQRTTITDANSAYSSVKLQELIAADKVPHTTVEAWREMIAQAIECHGTLRISDAVLNLDQTSKMGQNFLAHIKIDAVTATMTDDMAYDIKTAFEVEDGCDELFEFMFAAERAAETIAACATDVDLDALLNESAARDAR